MSPKVLGHTCVGLQLHFLYATYGSIPQFDEEGNILGGEDINCITA